MWSTCFQNALGTNSGEQRVEAVRLQEAPQREKIQVDLVGRLTMCVGQQEQFLLLSEWEYPTEEVGSAWCRLPRFDTHIEQIFDSSFRVVIASAQGTHDLILGEAHFLHVPYGTLKGFTT
jgi:hypothetical protein